MKNYGIVSRSFIALLFVIAGVMKIINFANTVKSIGMMGLPFPTIITILVVLVEVPIALAFAWGYKVRIMGWILIGFTILTIVIVHRDFSQGQNILMSLKNLAIIGGILSTISVCGCDKCEVKESPTVTS